MLTKIRDSLGYTIGFTFSLTFIFVFGLAFLYSSLSATIAVNASLAQKRAVLEAMGETFDSSDSSRIEDLYRKLTVRFYKKTVKEGQDFFERLEPNAEGKAPAESDLTFYETIIDGERVVGVTFGGGGMWGYISGVISTNAEVTKTRGIQIISHSETPGLGARITSDGFRSQFSAGTELEKGTVTLVKNKQGSVAGEVNAITGASVTSTAMNGLLAEGYKNLREIVEVKQ